MWWAGSAAPARFLVSILPLAALPIAAVWARSRAIGILLLLASVALIVNLVLLFGAPRICRSQERAAQTGINGGTPLTMESVTTDFLLFGVLGLAVASAAIAVRMVRRWH